MTAQRSAYGNNSVKYLSSCAEEDDDLREHRQVRQPIRVAWKLLKVGPCECVKLALRFFVAFKLGIDVGEYTSSTWELGVIRGEVLHRRRNLIELFLLASYEHHL